MFLGYGRSGHSLLGALLDAHPNVIVAHELDVLKYVQAGFSRYQIFQLLLENSNAQAKHGRRETGYIYEVQGQWQGRYTALHVIGDKKGGRSSLRLHENPDLLNKLRKTIGLPLKVFHVVRNPYDNIATAYRKRRRGSETLQDVIKKHFSQCQTVLDTKKNLNETELLEIRHEEIIAEPVRWLRLMCTFLGVDCPADYENQCAQIVFQSPHKSRNDINWTLEDLEMVRKKMQSFSFLSGYSYDQ